MAGQTQHQTRIPPADVVTLAPPPASRMRGRHQLLAASFVLLFVLPVAATALYLWGRAQDQYASVAGFTVQHGQAPPANEVLGGMMSQIIGGGSQIDTDLLYEFLQAQPLVEKIHDRLDLISHYSAPHDTDPVFALHPSPAIEDLTDYWQRVVQVSYDQASRLIELRVVAFDPDFAQQVTAAILEQCRQVLRDINTDASTSLTQSAQSELRRAEARLHDARRALVRFQTRTGFLNPMQEIEGRFAAISALQQKLAETQILLDMLHETAAPGDPRIDNATRQAKVIRARIETERALITTPTASPDQPAYPDLLSDYEALLTEREIAERAHVTALGAYEMARADAERQSRFLAVYTPPTRAGSARYPQRLTIIGLVALFSGLGWCVAALVAYAVRDSRIA